MPPKSRKQKLKQAEENASVYARQQYGHLQRPGAAKAVKRKLNRRMRQERKRATSAEE